MISIFIHWRNITAFHKHTNNITLVGVKAIYRFLKMNDSANARQFELYAVLSSKSMFTSNVRSHAQVFSLLIDDNFVDEYCKFIYKNNKPILILILYYSIIPIFFFQMWIFIIFVTSVSTSKTIPHHQLNMAIDFIWFESLKVHFNHDVNFIIVETVIIAHRLLYALFRNHHQFYKINYSK